MFDILRPFMISFAIGLMIGIERERSHPAGAQTSGVRTFILFAILGTFTGAIHSVVVTGAISAFVFGAILLGYFRSTEPEDRKAFIGLTTELTAGVVFCLGYVAVQRPFLAGIVALVVLIILLGREKLHVFARKQLKQKEIQATVVILVLSFTVLSFLPNRTIDPWQLINPQRLGLLVMALAIIQFGGYVAIRVFGQRLGILLMGFFGGLVSSGAIYVALPKFSIKHPKLYRETVAAAIFAALGMLVEFTIIIFIAAPALIMALAWPLTMMILVGLLSSLLVMRGAGKTAYVSEAGNPLDFKSILRLALFIGGMLILVAIVKRYIGIEGVRAISFFGGLFELHGVSLANATLFIENKLTLQEAALSLGLALSATYVTKFILLWSLARNKFVYITTLFLSAMLIVGVLAFYFTVT